MGERTRRDFLKAAALLSGGVGVSGFLPGSVARAMAIEPAAGSTYRDAEHVVILMQENRSFDHALGTLRGVRGLNDPRALRQANGDSVFVQTDGAGNSYGPWRLDIRDTRATWMGSLPHSRQSQVDAWNGGLHDRWLQAKRPGAHEYQHLPLTMGQYTREDLPFYYALADAFTVCDQHFCSVMSSTSPNRSVFWTGTVREEQRRGSRVFLRNEEIEREGMTWKTFPERLDEAGVSWKTYQNELTCVGGMSGEERDWLSNFSDNVLENFAAYKVEANAGGRARLEEQMAGLEEQARDLEKAVKKEKDPAEAARLSKRLGMVREHGERVKVWLGGSGAAGYARLTEAQKRLHDAAFVTNAGDPAYRTLAGLSFDDAGKTQTMMVPKGDVLYQFREDVKAGTLPAVSWLVASEKFSDHPASPWYGAWYVSEALDILASHPEVWKKTIFILTYDENDGYFDHAPSFVAADPRRPETGGASAGIDTGLEYGYVEDELELGVGEGEARSGPIGMGFRVPMIVASPWTRGGWVNSQVFDHTSTLMFMEEFVANRFGKTVREENISSWRRCVSGDLVSCFRGPGEVAPELMYLDRDKAVVGIQRARYKALPANFRKLTAAQIEAMNRSPLHAEGAMHQEPGIRPACAVPYELYAEGEVSGDGRQFVLRLKAGTEAHGARAAGAGFNVYLRNLKEGGGMRAATYAVKAGDGLAVEFPLVLFGSGGYAVEVHGPNGFYRSFAGVAEETGVEVRLSCEREGSTWTGDVGVHVRRGSGGPVGYEIRDNSYRGDAVRRVVAGGGDDTVVVPLKRSYGWYDFTVQVEGWKGHARFAGHVDTGRASFSDPLMGGVI